MFIINLLDVVFILYIYCVNLVNLNSNFQQSYDNIFHLKLSATMQQLKLLCIKSYP